MKLKTLIASAITGLFFAPLSFAEANNVIPTADNNAMLADNTTQGDAMNIAANDSPSLDNSTPTSDDSPTTNDNNVGSSDNTIKSSNEGTKDETATMDDTDY
jgi:hypothetical protein